MSRARDAQQFLWLLQTYLAPHWRAVLLLLATSYLATALATVFPMLMAPILDLALGTPVAGHERVPLSGLSLKNLGSAVFQWVGIQTVDDRFRAILILCLAYVATGVLKGWVDFGNYMLALWIRVKAAAAMQADLFRHLLSLSMGFFNRQRTGELISRVEGDTRAAAAGVETLVCTLLTAPVLIAFYGYLLVRTSPKLVGAALGAAVLHVGVTRLIKGPIRRLAADQFSAVADVVTRLHESIQGIRVVKSFGAEAFEISRLLRTLGKAVGVNVRFGVYKHVEEPMRVIVNYTVEAIIVLFAAYELLAGRLAAPAFFLFLYVGRAVMVQVGLLSSAYTHAQQVLAAATRVGEIFALKPEVQDGTETIDAFRDRIVVSDVWFDYGHEAVLERVNLEIKRGEIVAFVGPSGTGKSTLADLILRLYDPVRGRITIDGCDIRRVRQDSYRRLFGVVAQEDLLFNATVRENIGYGREGMGDVDVVRAAKMANAHEFIVEFPDRYETVVGERGVRLSGGQRQRIAIARAIVGNPAILVLDEATSALDSESERLVQQAIERVIHGATSIVIAHRLSTVLNADKIVVINRGRVEAIGAHAELLATNETYARLYKLQFSDAESAGRV